MPTLALEQEFRAAGWQSIAGLDEAGRGAWSGPVVAGAVILPLERPDLADVLEGVDDSKRLSPRQREQLVGVICNVAVSWGVGGASAQEIDQIGIVPATRAAMQRALAMLSPAPDALLIDALNLKSVSALPQRWLNYGDSISLSIAAASIIAKVSRDRAMQAFDRLYPGYELARHKGYGTAAHRAALERLGPSAIHRHSFAPIRRFALPPSLFPAPAQPQNAL